MNSGQDESGCHVVCRLGDTQADVVRRLIDFYEFDELVNLRLSLHSKGAPPELIAEAMEQARAVVRRVAERQAPVLLKHARAAYDD